jgi:hypothetical protein
LPPWWGVVISIFPDSSPVRAPLSLARSKAQAAIWTVDRIRLYAFEWGVQVRSRGRWGQVTPPAWRRTRSRYWSKQRNLWPVRLTRFTHRLRPSVGPLLAPVSWWAWTSKPERSGRRSGRRPNGDVRPPPRQPRPRGRAQPGSPGARWSPAGGPFTVVTLRPSERVRLSPIGLGVNP